jgi:uncharacterized protein (TIGR01777 family)
MKIVMAGGTGFLGRPLVERLAAGGHDIVILTRTPRAGAGTVRYVGWRPDGTAGDWSEQLDGADAVINLAGENLADRRWTTEYKEVLRQSRILSTRSLVAAVRRTTHKPSILLSGSAIGYYGATGDEPLDESFPPGSDFLATLCVDWEAEAHAASALGCRVIIVRTGVVLASDGGALKKMMPPFLFFVGGPIGSGTQFMSWIHRDDWIALVVWLLEQPNVTGVFNATAPNPVTNRDFSTALGRALHRPSWLTVPRFALRAILGEMANIALFNGQRVAPKRALDSGFTFSHTQIDDAMRAALVIQS